MLFASSNSITDQVIQFHKYDNIPPSRYNRMHTTYACSLRVLHPWTSFRWNSSNCCCCCSSRSLAIFRMINVRMYIIIQYIYTKSSQWVIMMLRMSQHAEFTLRNRLSTRFQLMCLCVWKWKWEILTNSVPFITYHILTACFLCFNAINGIFYRKLF